MKTCARVILSAGLLLLSVSGPASLAAQRTFVASTGLDTNSCTLTAPCRGFQRAVDLVDPGGEVVALDSAGYGTINIAKSVAVIVPPGVHAAITALSGDAVAINSATASVVLRGLYLSSLGGGNNGINATAFDTLHIESCVVSGFSLFGMNLSPTNTPARIFIKDSIVRGNGTGGIRLGNGDEATLDRVRVESNNGNGIIVTRPSGVLKARVSNSVLARNFHGLSVESGGEAMVVSTLAAGNTQSGFASAGLSLTGEAKLTLVNSQASQNNVGVSVSNFGSPATVTISGVTISNNGTGISVSAGATLRTQVNNTLDGNVTPTSILGTQTTIAPF